MPLMIILAALQEEIPTLHKEDHVFVTGLGKVNATLQATKLILEYKPEFVVNFGTAGSISNEFSNELVECTGFMQRDMDCSPLGFEKYVTPYEEGDHLVVEFREYLFPNDINKRLKFVRAVADADCIIKGKARTIFYYNPSGKQFAQADKLNGIRLKE